MRREARESNCRSHSSLKQRTFEPQPVRGQGLGTKREVRFRRWRSYGGAGGRRETGFQLGLADGDCQTDYDGPEGTWAEVVDPQFDQVCVGACDCFVRQIAGPLRQGFDVGSLVGEMIGKFSHFDEMAADAGKRVAEAGGIADAAKRCHRFIGQRGERFFASRGR